MAKFKSKIKDNQIKIKAKLSRKEKLNDVELEFFIREHASKNIRGLFKVRRLRGRKLEYFGPQGDSLSRIFAVPMSKKDFFFFIGLVVNFSREMNAYAFPMNKVVMDMNNIYYNRVAQELRFIYLPLEVMRGDADYIGLMEQMVYATKPIPQDDNGYTARFISFLAGLPSYDAEKVEQFMSYEVYGGMPPQPQMPPMNPMQLMNQINPMSPMEPVSPPNMNNGGGLLDEVPSIMAPYMPPAPSPVIDPEATGYLNADPEATGILGGDTDATGKLDSGYMGGYGQPQFQPQIIYGRLYRISTGETVDINKAVFRIGKEKQYANYCVTGNGAVSRNHADIVSRGNRHFVIDLNSKNRTFINGNVIPVRQETEIFNGDRLRLADEEFVFSSN